MPFPKRICTALERAPFSNSHRPTAATGSIHPAAKSAAVAGRAGLPAEHNKISTKSVSVIPTPVVCVVKRASPQNRPHNNAAKAFFAPDVRANQPAHNPADTARYTES